MYVALLVLHSWTRWLVLPLLLARAGLAGANLARGAAYGKLDRALSGAAVGVFHLQVILGLVLYAVSPVVATALGDMKGAMKDAVLRFYAVEHGPTLAVVAVALTVASALARRAADDRRKHLISLVGFGLTLLVTFALIPWPFRGAIGRPLFLLSVGN